MEGTKMLVDEWVETVWQVIGVRKKTIQDYKNLYRRHLKPVIGHMEVKEIDIFHIQQKLLALPPQTGRHCLMLLKTIAREALLYNITDTNFAQRLKSRPIQVTPKKFLTWDEVNTKDWGRYNNQIRFLALHGLRWSEAVVLTTDDIKDGNVLINRSKYGDCKSKSSVRRIPYLGHFEPLPKSYKPMQHCANKHGVTVHSFRRTYAYLLKTQGIHVTTAQKLLGHSDPMMTLRVYTSVLDSEIDDAGDILENFLKIGNKLTV
jgi:integrase